METTVREDDAATPGEQPARRAAYADLVAAVLDLRSTEAAAAFDRALSDAVTVGALTEERARELRWLQRESVRDVVTHAANVLPATLVAMEVPASVTTAPPSTIVATEPEGAVAASDALEHADDHESGHDEATAEQESAPPVDLTARRLLVAGLRPIPDPPFP